MKGKLAYAVVSKNRVIDVDSVRGNRKDVSMSIHEEETGHKIRRVRITLEELKP